MNKQCKQCGQEFLIDSRDQAFYKRIDVSEPSFCAPCRRQRRLSWRNDRTLYRRKCDKSGKDMISLFGDHHDMVVYDSKIWWGDDWNALDYGREFDFSRPFFEQFDELSRSVPYPNLFTAHGENSDYTNYNIYNKNSYLCFAGNYAEDCLYCYTAERCKDCVDCLFVWYSELCYECVHCEDCYALKYSLHSRNCSNSYFLEDCIGCKDCFMCYGLTQKQYCVLNKQYSKEEYEKLLAEFDLEELRERYLKERGTWERPDSHNVSAEDCSGDYILHSKNCTDCYIMANECEDCRYVFNGFPGLKDSYDCTYAGEHSDLMYECLGGGAASHKLAFCAVVFSGCSDVSYSILLIGCSDCFGCVGIRKKRFCIFNKQYTEQEYRELLPRIIEHMKKTGEWGEFFPTEISPYCYNETVASEYFEMDKEEVLAKGWQWRDAVEEIAAEDAEDLRKCEVTGKSFRLIKKELEFYKKHDLPLPRKCFAQRHKERMALCDKSNLK
ncbi:zinc-ribbon domain containing protein [Candidatus Gracilibacteria bacterium]|nr:zinc-ribbon domain containing protein [Candidatus Gracilibacteria bacterium]